MRLLVTGFGPFADADENPSQVLATALGKTHDHAILPVVYHQTREFARQQKQSDHTHILCLGLNARAEELRYELLAHNRCGLTPDVDGKAWVKPKIRSKMPHSLGSTLLSPDQLEKTKLKINHDPGGYLCNFLLFQLLSRYPDKKIAFVHVPPFDVVPKAKQLTQLRALIRQLA